MYLYETHCHTSTSSFCGKIDAQSQVRAYAEMGYSGICLTEHFPLSVRFQMSDAPWEDKVALLLKSFEIAREEGEKTGLSVFFAWEYGYHHTDFLTYGLDAAWLLAHPEIPDLTPDQYAALVHEAGGYIVHAHPFRQAKFIQCIRLYSEITDAVETVNANRTDFENKMAKQYAENFGFPESYGSDNHIGFQKRMCGILSPKPLSSVADLIEGIRTRAFSFYFKDRED